MKAVLTIFTKPGHWHYVHALLVEAGHNSSAERLVSPIRKGKLHPAYMGLATQARLVSGAKYPANYR